MINRTMAFMAVLAIVIAVGASQSAEKPKGLYVSRRALAGNHYFNDTNIMFNATASVNIEYEYFDAATNETKKAVGVVPVPSNYMAESTLKGDDLKLSLSFYDGWMITLTFTEYNTSNTDTYNVSSVAVDYNTATLATADKAKYFPKYNFSSETDLTGNVTNSTANYPIHAPSAHTYQCVYGDTRLPVTDIVTVVLKDLHVQAFMKTEDEHVWQSGAMCEADVSQSDLVPIIVGAALVVLLIVVLVGYLVGRARAARQGYASV